MRQLEGSVLAFAETFLADVRLAARSLLRSPMLSGVIILSFAISIGANTAVFGAVDALFLRRLPVDRPEDLVSVNRYDRRVSVRYGAFRTLSFPIAGVRLAGYRFEGVTATVNEQPQDIWLDLVTGGYFKLLGVRPLIGRVIDDADERTAANVAVISYDLWTRAFGGRRDVLGQVFKLNDVSTTVVGVMPEGYYGIHYARRFDAAVPISISPAGFTDVRRLAVSLIGRAEATPSRAAQGQALLGALQACCVTAPLSDLAPQHPHFVPVDNGPTGDHGELFAGSPGVGPPIVLEDASRGLVWAADLRARYAALATALSGGVLLLLLIACANIATLLTARSESREREFAVRLALGASRGRLTRQLLAEALVLASVGGSGGALAAWWLTPFALRSDSMPADGTADLMTRPPGMAILGFMIAATVGCTIGVTIWPARRAGRAQLLSSLSGARRRIAGAWTIERSLITVQIGLAMVLVCAAALFVATVRNLTRFDGGYRTRRILVANVEIHDQACTGSIYLADITRCYGDTATGATRSATYDRFRRNVGTVGGVDAVAFTRSAPVWQDLMMSMRVKAIEEPGAPATLIRVAEVGPDFFGATGIGLVAGRDFDASDLRTSDPVAIVSESFARRHFVGQSAIGGVIELARESGAGRRVRVVGVARDANYDRWKAHYIDLRNPEQEILYRPILQSASVPPRLTAIIRTRGDPTDVASTVRQMAARVPGMQLTRLMPIGTILDRAAARERVSAGLAVAFGVVAMLLSAVGVFAVLVHQVTRRQHEIGIRMALGARTRDVLDLVLKETVVVAGSGAVLGVPVALAASWAVRAQLYGVSALNPWAVAGAAAGLAVVCIVASMLPARRAASVDPLVALLSE